MTACELRAVAPRLCRAYDGLRRAVTDTAHQHRVAQDERLSADRCLAHRELQLVRAGSRGKSGYVLERQRKLHEIRGRRERAAEAERAARDSARRARADLSAVDDVADDRLGRAA